MKPRTIERFDLSADLYADGASRGNPGPSAAAWLVVPREGDIISDAISLGTGTNNRAEYEALMHGLLTARDAGIRIIRIHMDSELVVRQVTGVYCVRSAGLRPFYDEVTALLRQFSRWSLTHTRRDTPEIQRVDALCNAVLDRARDEGNKNKENERMVSG